MESCLGCEVVTGSIKTPGGFIFQDDFWTITHSVSTTGAPLKGMIILQPRRHTTQLAELDSQEIKNLGLYLRETCKAIEEILDPARIYACSVGEGVKHVHFMILPRMEGMPIGAELFKQVIEQQMWTCSFEEATEIAVEVQNKLDCRLLHGG
jgi:diadenosine tetraphosphate (Ap4A) HIT family hydrolase